MKDLPVRLRLSLWYFAMFATAACLLSAASWWMLRVSLDSSEYQELLERAQDVQQLLAHEAPDTGLDGLTRQFTAVYSVKDDGKWLQVMDQDGNWIYRSRRIATQAPELPRPALLPGRGVIADFRQGTRYVRVLAYPVTVRGKAYSVQTGMALNKSIALLNSFRFDLLLLAPVVILLAAAGGHWMGRKALWPVALLAAEARRIHDRNLDVRLPVPRAKDEISDLSRALNQMLERIDNAFATVRAFTGNASHELRTPITLLRTEIEVALMRDRDGAEYRATLRRLHEETVRMTTLVENLLSIAREEAGAETASLKPIDVSALFQRIHRDWTASMQLSLLDFRTEIQSPDMAVLGDPAGIVRLLTVLLENARKYTPPGGCVVLSATCDWEGDWDGSWSQSRADRRKAPRVTLTVRDTGIGIAAEHLPRIFDRFYRGGPTRGAQTGDSNSRGSGLGLALGKWIAERHGTRLTVESQPGQGSCFSFSLERLSPAPSEIDELSVSTTAH